MREPKFERLQKVYPIDLDLVPGFIIDIVYNHDQRYYKYLLACGWDKEYWITEKELNYGDGR